MEVQSHDKINKDSWVQVNLWTHLPSSGHHADPDGAGGTRRVLQTGATLARVGVLRVLLGEHIHSVGGHLFLSDQHLKKRTDPVFSGQHRSFLPILHRGVKKTSCFTITLQTCKKTSASDWCHMMHHDIGAYLLWAIDDEITSGVQRTFIEFTEVSVRQATQQAVSGAQHDGNFTNKGFLVLGLNLILPLLYDGLCDVNIQGGWIPARIGGRSGEHRWHQVTA